jgi:predicted branched-subunit amino acid permease
VLTAMRATSLASAATAPTWSLCSSLTAAMTTVAVVVERRLCWSVAISTCVIPSNDVRRLCWSTTLFEEVFFFFVKKSKNQKPKESHLAFLILYYRLSIVIVC